MKNLLPKQRRTKIPPQTRSWTFLGIFLILCFLETHASRAQQQRQNRQPGSRRSQRVVPLKELTVASPDGQVKFTVAPNAERLNFTVTLGNTTVLEPSPVILNLDGYDLSSGVMLSKVERYELNETYPWHGAHSTATNHCQGAKLSLAHDLSFIDYTWEVRVFNDGVAFRHVIPGQASASRVPDEHSTFILPAGTTVWFHDLGGHYEAAYQQHDISEVKAGQWAGPP